MAKQQSSRAVLRPVELDDYSESKNLWIHGMTGVGKTVLAGQLPNNLFLSSDRGVKAAKRAGSDSKAIRISSWDDAWGVLLAAEEGEYDGIEWITIDTADSIERRRMRQLMDEAYAVNPAKRDEYQPGQDLYAKTQNSITRLVERFVDLPINVLFLSQTMRVEDQDGDAMWIPAIQGGASKGYNVSFYCMSLCDVVGYMGVAREGKEEVRRMVWHHTVDPSKGITYVAKDRFSVLPKFMNNPTMPEILRLINGPARQAGNPKKGKAKNA